MLRAGFMFALLTLFGCGDKGDDTGAMEPEQAEPKYRCNGDSMGHREAFRASAKFCG